MNVSETNKKKHYMLQNELKKVCSSTITKKGSHCISGTSKNLKRNSEHNIEI